MDINSKMGHMYLKIMTMVKVIVILAYVIGSLSCQGKKNDRRPINNLQISIHLKENNFSESQLSIKRVELEGYDGYIETITDTNADIKFFPQKMSYRIFNGAVSFSSYKAIILTLDTTKSYHALPVISGESTLKDQSIPLPAVDNSIKVKIYHDIFIKDKYAYKVALEYDIAESLVQYHQWFPAHHSSAFRPYFRAYNQTLSAADSEEESSSPDLHQSTSEKSVEQPKKDMGLENKKGDKQGVVYALDSSSIAIKIEDQLVKLVKSDVTIVDMQESPLTDKYLYLGQYVQYSKGEKKITVLPGHFILRSLAEKVDSTTTYFSLLAINHQFDTKINESNFIQVDKSALIDPVGDIPDMYWSVTGNMVLNNANEFILLASDAELILPSQTTLIIKPGKAVPFQWVVTESDDTVLVKVDKEAESFSEFFLTLSTMPFNLSVIINAIQLKPGQYDVMKSLLPEGKNTDIAIENLPSDPQSMIQSLQAVLANNEHLFFSSISLKGIYLSEFRTFVAESGVFSFNTSTDDSVSNHKILTEEKNQDTRTEWRSIAMATIGIATISTLVTGIVAYANYLHKIKRIAAVNAANELSRHHVDVAKESVQSIDKGIQAISSNYTVVQDVKEVGTEKAIVNFLTEFSQKVETNPLISDVDKLTIEDVKNGYLKKHSENILPLDDMLKDVSSMISLKDDAIEKYALQSKLDDSMRSNKTNVDDGIQSGLNVGRDIINRYEHISDTRENVVEAVAERKSPDKLIKLLDEVKKVMSEELKVASSTIDSINATISNKNQISDTTEIEKGNALNQYEVQKKLVIEKVDALNKNISDIASIRNSVEGVDAASGEGDMAVSLAFEKAHKILLDRVVSDSDNLQKQFEEKLFFNEGMASISSKSDEILKKMSLDTKPSLSVMDKLKAISDAIAFDNTTKSMPDSDERAYEYHNLVESYQALTSNQTYLENELEDSRSNLSRVTADFSALYQEKNSVDESLIHLLEENVKLQEKNNKNILINETISASNENLIADNIHLKETSDYFSALKDRLEKVLLETNSMLREATDNLSSAKEQIYHDAENIDEKTKQVRRLEKYLSVEMDKVAGLSKQVEIYAFDNINDSEVKEKYKKRIEELNNILLERDHKINTLRESEFNLLVDSTMRELQYDDTPEGVDIQRILDRLQTNNYDSDFIQRFMMEVKTRYSSKK